MRIKNAIYATLAGVLTVAILAGSCYLAKATYSVGGESYWTAGYSQQVPGSGWIPPTAGESCPRGAGPEAIPARNFQVGPGRLYQKGQIHSAVKNCECGEDCKCPPHICDAGLCKKNYAIMISASWCGPCKSMYPMVDALNAKGYHIEVYDVTKKEYAGLADEYKIRAFPTFIVFEGGKEVKREVGVQQALWFTSNLKTVAEQEEKPVDEPVQKKERFLLL